jgi:hypothetical protein
MRTEIVRPNIHNFVKSLRDIGYSFEIAVADIIDNSITAFSKKIDIVILPEPELRMEVLDDGYGMTEIELKEAMRLATKDPEEKREKQDLGRFGLGLKTASFSQCKKVTVVSKKAGVISAKQWDLDYISEKNEWELITPELNTLTTSNLLNELQNKCSGTLVIWENIDRYNNKTFAHEIDVLRDHIALVFHRFLEGRPGSSKIDICINGLKIEPFDPFNKSHPATQQLSIEKLNVYDHKVNIEPFILPHHSKVTQKEYEYNATKSGYIKSQGFYLYREDRLLIYGTWWGLHKASDAHKLVRIKIDITSDQDKYWGIDIKKSKAQPAAELRSELKRVISQVTKKGSKPYSGRGRKILDRTTIKFWDLVPYDNKIRFVLNFENPIYEQLKVELNDSQIELLNKYLSCVQSYIPVEAVQAQLQERPHDIDQRGIVDDAVANELIEYLKAAGVNYEEIFKIEVFKDKGIK